jgi:hypothetical protein
MSELLQEFVHSGSERLRVDREAGIIRGVKLLGLVSRNGRRYREDALSQAIALYEGAKVNINHPKGHPLAPRDYQERLGDVRGVVLRPGEGLFADLHFNPKHSLSEQLLWDAEHAPQNVGMSHNVLARTTRDGADTVVESITKVNSIDLVADPATTSGLYEQAESQEPRVESREQEERTLALDSQLSALGSLTLEQLRQHRPDLVREVQRDYESQLEQVRGELDALVARDKIARRRERILELLHEHNLPLPPTTGAVDSQLISREFIESLMRAADDETLQQLVEARAELVRSAWQWTNQRRTPDRRPRSRDQMAFEPTGRTCSTKEFVAALRDR